MSATALYENLAYERVKRVIDSDTTLSERNAAVRLGEPRSVTCVGGVINIPVRNLSNISCAQMARTLERELGAGADMVTTTNDQGVPSHKITVPLSLLQQLVREATAPPAPRSYALELRIVGALLVAIALLIAYSRTCPLSVAAPASVGLMPSWLAPPLCALGRTLDAGWALVWRRIARVVA